MLLHAGHLLLALRAQVTSAALPERILIAPWGETCTTDGEAVIVNDETLRVLAANQRANGFEEIALDFEHNTFALDAKGRVAKPPEPVKVAAYGTLEVVSGEGIYLVLSSWTPEGREMFRGGHYRDLSPVLAFNSRREVIFVHSAALTRHGQLDGLHAFSAHFDAVPYGKSRKSPPTPQQPPPIMDHATTDAAPAFKALAARLLGLSDDASDEEIHSAATARLEKGPGGDQGEAASDAAPEPHSAEAPGSRTTDAGVTVEALAADFAAYKAAQEAEAKQRLMREAAAAGKIVPLDDESVAITPYSVLATMLAKLPAGAVPLEGRTAEGAGERPTLQALSAEETEVCANLGITPDAFRKHNPAA